MNQSRNSTRKGRSKVYMQEKKEVEQEDESMNLRKRRTA